MTWLHGWVVHFTIFLFFLLVHALSLCCSLPLALSLSPSSCSLVSCPPSSPSPFKETKQNSKNRNLPLRIVAGRMSQERRMFVTVTRCKCVCVCVHPFRFTGKKNKASLLSFLSFVGGCGNCSASPSTTHNTQCTRHPSHPHHPLCWMV